MEGAPGLGDGTAHYLGIAAIKSESKALNAEPSTHSLYTCRRRKGATRLEDGNAHYLGIAAVRHGFCPQSVTKAAKTLHLEP